MGDFLKVCPKRYCISTVGTRTDLYPKDPNTVSILDFFGSTRPTEISLGRIEVSGIVVKESGTSPQGLLTDGTGQAPPAKRYQFFEQFPSHLFK